MAKSGYSEMRALIPFGVEQKKMNPKRKLIDCQVLVRGRGEKN